MKWGTFAAAMSRMWTKSAQSRSSCARSGVGGLTVFRAVERMRKPRARATSKQKAADELLAWVAWQAEVLAELYRQFADPQS